MRMDGNKRNTVEEEEERMLGKTVKYLKTLESRGEEGIREDTRVGGIGGGGCERGGGS